MMSEQDGVVLGQRYTPIEKVGICVPGNTAAYPSSVLMDAIPAKIAGVREIVMGRALKMAVAPDEKHPGEIPSTKGVL